MVVTLRDGETFQGFLNVIHQDYVVLAATGHQPVYGFGTSLGFPLSDIKSVERA